MSEFYTETCSAGHSWPQSTMQFIIQNLLQSAKCNPPVQDMVPALHGCAAQTKWSSRTLQSGIADLPLRQLSLGPFVCTTQTNHCGFFCTTRVNFVHCLNIRAQLCGDNGTEKCPRSDAFCHSEKKSSLVKRST